MASKYIGDLCFSTGEYEQNGEKKKRWAKAAAVFESPDGRRSYRFESLPASGWSGWMSFFQNERQQTRKHFAPNDIEDKPIDLNEIPF